MSDFDRILTSAPLDITAARVTSRGERYEPTFKPSRERFDAPPLCVPLDEMDDQVREFAALLIGTCFGRMTVIGYAREQGSPKKRSRWVVRCSCGYYEIRKVKAIRNPMNSNDCCQACEHTVRFKRRYDELGSRPVSDFTNTSEDSA